MSGDRLERALHEMREETVNDSALEAARARVWHVVAGASTTTTCAEFQSDLRAYLDGALGRSRRLLMEDHLGRCPACRAALADLRGERRVLAMPQQSSSRRTRWGAYAAAAALLLSVGYLGRGAIDSWLAPGGPRATLVSATGTLYRLPGGALAAGAAIGERELVRTGPGGHAVLRLADGSTVDVNERTELFLTAAWSGQAVHLQRGDVIVEAAKQRRGRLRVLTRDSIASVKGTVFAVSAGIGGSVVSVLEGSVAVNQPGRDVILAPGQQAASNPALARSVAEAVSWSPDADEYLQLLASFAKIERGLAEIPGDLRSTSDLLPYLPPGAMVYGAVPNLGGKIGLAKVLAEEQATENAAFRAWWNSETGLELRQIVDRAQGVSSLLGDEVVFCLGSAGPGDEVPMVMARVRPASRTQLASALDALFAEAGESSRPYSVTEDLMVISDSPTHLAWALARLGQGANSPFAAAIGERYRRGAGWLLAMDAAALVAMASEDDAPPIELAGMMGLKYVFLEQRAPAGADENEVTLVFPDRRTGMGSWLADAGSGGAAEYLPADALAAGYVSMRQPEQLFQEFTALMTRRDESFERELAQAEQKLGAGFMANLTAAMGTEAAFALNGFSLNGPTWVMAALVNSAPVVDSSLRTLMDTFNAGLAPDEQPRRIVFEQETVSGRVWNTMRAGNVPFGVTWTYDLGYLVAASDRAAAERALATRHGGAPLVWSSAFQGQLPASAGIHPSAFAWLNTRGTFAMFSTLSPSPAVTELLAARDPVLVVFDGSPEQIHAASRTRLSGLIMDVMLLESLSRTREGLQAATVRQ
jgi:ferric-dicitrate binding protein FerR (iron transport regulator)